MSGETLIGTLAVAFFAVLCLLYIWAAERLRRIQEDEDHALKDDKD